MNNDQEPVNTNEVPGQPVAAESPAPAAPTNNPWPPTPAPTTSQPQAQTTVFAASIWQRFFNAIIDEVVGRFILVIIIGVIINASKAQVSPSIAILLNFFALPLYLLICESIWQRSLGKLITKTKVVQKDGTRPSFLRILGRTAARYIPFDALSFLFSKHPMGWHDAVSGTIVVSNSYSSEEVQKVQKDKEVSILAIVFFIFLGIVVLGILSSVVLASLSVARTKSVEVQIKSEVSQIRIQGEMYYSLHNNSYKGFCGQKETTENIAALTSEYTCNDSDTAWAISVQGKNPEFYCGDNTGRVLQTSRTPLGKAVTCQ